MTVRITDPDAFARLVRAETDEFLRHDTEHDGPCGFRTWHAAFVAGPASVRRQRRLSPTVYGLGGWARYAVRDDGELVFLEGFSSSAEHTARARAAGFRVEW